MINPTPRLRFAPSPTGPLHLGGARTAMYNWAAARALGGTFLLRIEDTDRARSTDASLQIILTGLRWLGMDWDEGPEQGGAFGPYSQMQRLHLYRAAADELLQKGHAYLCYCTPEEIETGRKVMEAAKAGFIGYNGRCRNLTERERAAFVQQGLKPNLRFKMPAARVMTVHDLVRGEVEVNTKELDDFVMLRPDGVPLYNFACVVDDIGMKITHVVRGEEHFLNGIKQRLLFEALGSECPLYAHIPLILNKDGKKLSKRDADTNMLEYRDKGYLPDAVFNYIALLGWGFSGERDLFTRQEMVEVFKLEHIGKSGAKFDEEKLRWMCGEYLRRFAAADCLQNSKPWLTNAVPQAAFTTHPAWLANIIACYQERVAILSEFAPKIGWLFVDLPVLDEAAQQNLGKDQAAKQWLLRYADLLANSNLPPSFPADRTAADVAVSLPTKKAAAVASCAFATPQQIEQECRAFTEQLGVKFGDFVHPVRAALSGTDKGPGLFDIVFLLGKDACIKRLRAAAS